MLYIPFIGNTSTPIPLLVNALQGSYRSTEIQRYPNLELAEDVAQKVNGFMVYHPDDKTRSAH